VVSSTSSAYRRIVDDFGNTYAVEAIPGDGFCGYRCFALSVLGNSDRFLEIVADCNAVLQRHQTLFQRRSDIRNFEQYCTELTLVATQYANNQTTVQPEHLYIEDCHVLALAVLYKLAVFVFLMPECKWTFFNQLGQRGFICLLNTNNIHYEVLRGFNGEQPRVPRRAHWQNLDPDNIDDIVDSHNPYAVVWQWPGGTPTPVMAYHADIIQTVNVNTDRVGAGHELHVPFNTSLVMVDNASRSVSV
jgi:hypothetical protein